MILLLIQVLQILFLKLFANKIVKNAILQVLQLAPLVTSNQNINICKMDNAYKIVQLVIF